jgi:hypothetical protein
VTVNGSLTRDQLRALVREVVRDAVAGVVPTPAPTVPAPTGPLATDEKARTDTVRIATNEDLDAFVRQLLRLFENPKTRDDLRAGRLSFRLARNGRGTPATRRIDSGAVTERHIADMAESGGVLVLGHKAVLTPLAREKARAVGITIEKERR